MSSFEIHSQNVMDMWVMAMWVMAGLQSQENIKNSVDSALVYYELKWGRDEKGCKMDVDERRPLTRMSTTRKRQVDVDH